MWGENSKECELNCQCSGLIMESFTINSGNGGTKRRREESIAQNFKLKLSPHSLEFNHPSSPYKSPTNTPKRRVLGEIQNSPLVPKYLKSPLAEKLQESPLTSRLLNSPKINTFMKRSSTKISRIFEERTRFKMSSNKENECIETESYIVSEETRDSAFSPLNESPVGRVLQKSRTVKNWTLAKMTSDSPSTSYTTKQSETITSKREIFGHIDEISELDSDMETLHDLDEEFNCENFEQCSKYEIISTDSPDIISRGRTSSSRKISSKNFVFGAPIGDKEQSTSFNKPVTVTRMLNFEDETFEFASPENLKPKTSQTNLSVKKSLKFFNETPTKNVLRHENSNSSIGSMSTTSSLSQNSSKFRLFTSESTTSMESGFMSEIEEPFLEIEDSSNSSPKMADFSELLSGMIKEDFAPEAEFSLKRPVLQRSLSYNPDMSRARVSLFSKDDEKRSQKRPEPLTEELSCSKKKKSNFESFITKKPQNRPVLQRAYSENAASIMSALARSASEPDLIGDFSVPFALPVTSGDHSDLKSVSCETVAALLRGEYQDSVNDFQVIDCRYPYEFNGGHITGAKNLYSPDQILSLINKPLEDKAGRSILLFHCEFSLERGPKLYRFLRSSDRAKNKENYPSLHYPEIYLLHEGYRAFFNKFPDLCTPSGYTMMTDPEHKTELQKFRRMYPTSGRRSFMF